MRKAVEAYILIILSAVAFAKPTGKALQASRGTSIATRAPDCDRWKDRQSPTEKFILHPSRTICRSEYCLTGPEVLYCTMDPPDGGPQCRPRRGSLTNENFTCVFDGGCMIRSTCRLEYFWKAGLLDRLQLWIINNGGDIAGNIFLLVFMICNFVCIISRLRFYRSFLRGRPVVVQVIVPPPKQNLVNISS